MKYLQIFVVIIIAASTSTAFARDASTLYVPGEVIVIYASGKVQTLFNIDAEIVAGVHEKHKRYLEAQYSKKSTKAEEAKIMARVHAKHVNYLEAQYYKNSTKAEEAEIMARAYAKHMNYLEAQYSKKSTKAEEVEIVAGVHDKRVSLYVQERSSNNSIKAHEILWSALVLLPKHVLAELYGVSDDYVVALQPNYFNTQDMPARDGITPL